MESVERTKYRVLGEAIQSNIKAPRGLRSRFPQPRKSLLLPLSLWSFFLVAALVYFLVPGPVVSRGTPASSETAKAGALHLARAVAPLPAEAEIPLSALRPLNPAVVPLAVRKIVIDPGHGGRQHGAISESGVSEKEITLDVALRLRRLMEKSPFEVVMTRQSDKSLSLQKRVAFANASHADLFVSIHVNWMEPRTIRPLETYYVGPTEDAEAIRLAALENRESGYSLSDYRQLLEQIYIDTKRHQSHRFAEAINAELYRSLRRVNPELDNRGVKMAPFLVLVGTEMPAILVEVSCLSNEDEVDLLTKGDYREKIAEALLKGIRAYASAIDGNVRKGG